MPHMRQTKHSKQKRASTYGVEGQGVPEGGKIVPSDLTITRMQYPAQYKQYAIYHQRARAKKQLLKRRIKRATVISRILSPTVVYLANTAEYS